MTIEKQYYLNCNKCGFLYESKADDALGLEEEAIDDGWEISDDEGYDGNGECLNTHACPICLGLGTEDEDVMNSNHKLKVSDVWMSFVGSKTLLTHTGVGLSVSFTGNENYLKALEELASKVRDYVASDDFELAADEVVVVDFNSGGSGWTVTPNKGIKITHIPTQLSVSCDTERSQHKNKHIAITRLTKKVKSYYLDK